jgi:hypothetical protein
MMHKATYILIGANVLDVVVNLLSGPRKLLILILGLPNPELEAVEVSKGISIGHQVLKGALIRQNDFN